jgi:hypothetical protein
VIETANPHPFRRSFSVVGVANVLIAVVLLAWLRPPDSAGAFGYAVGALFICGLLAGLFAGFAARGSKKVLSTWNYVFLAVPIDVMFLIGALSG